MVSGLRVAVCGVKSISSGGGGIETGTREVARRLAAKGYVLTLFSQGASTRSVCTEGIQILNVNAVNHKYLSYMSYMRGVMRWMQMHRPTYDLVHLHSPAIHGFWIYALRRAGYRVLAHSHGLEWRAAKWPFWFRAFMRLSEYAGAVAAEKVVVVSEEERRHFSRFKKAEEVLRIPNGLPNRCGSAPHPQASVLGLETDGYYLFVGRIVPQKCVHELIRAFSQTETEKRLVIAGASSHTGIYMKKVVTAARQDHRVMLTGQLSHRQVTGLCQNCFALVLPSDHEGHPNVVLEAISSATPCLVSDIPAHREIFGGDGSYIDVRDVTGFMRTLQRLEKSPVDYAAAKRVVLRLRESLPTWDCIAARFDQLYHNMITHRRGPQE